MNPRAIVSAWVVALALACSQPSTPEPVTPATPREELESILAGEIDLRQDSLYAAFAEEQGRAEMMLLLPALALDTTADPLARANAVLRMGAEFIVDFETYVQTIEDPDPRVRGATLGVVGPLATRDPNSAVPILARGLVDPEIGIQAKALQELRDRDLDVLRFYIETTEHPELRDIALQTLRNAYAWGAPLPVAPDGSLRRATPAGVELAFRAQRSWPEWDLHLGSLSATPAGGTERRLADSVEVMSTIIPAVGDPTGRYVAVETRRQIEVHDLETGAVRTLGAGLAPRPLPFTPDFLYFREIRRYPLDTGGIRFAYELVRGSFTGTNAAPFDTVLVDADPAVRGFMSPVRWARIHDRGRRFVVETDGLRNHPLPTPAFDAEEDSGT